MYSFRLDDETEDILRANGGDNYSKYIRTLILEDAGVIKDRDFTMLEIKYEVKRIVKSLDIMCKQKGYFDERTLCQHLQIINKFERYI